MNVFSAFDGHSGGRIALDVLGIKPTNYYASEIDKYAEKLSEFCYPKEIERMASIMNWREWLIDWSTIDLFIGGSPCQGFSMAGKMAGTAAILDGEKHIVDSREKYLELKEAGAEFLSQSFLFWEYVLLLDHVKQCNPKVKFFLENVKMKKEFLNLITDAIGVEPTFINSALLSAQNRQRYYWCNWHVTQPEDKGIVLADILECEPFEKTIMTDKFTNRNKDAGCLRDDVSGKVKSLSAMEYVKNGRQGDYIAIKRVDTATDIKGHDYNKRIYSDQGKAPSLAANSGGNLEPKVSIQQTPRGKNKGGIKALNGKTPTLSANSWEHNNKLSIQKPCLKNVHYRKLTPRECARLQTVPEHIIDKMLSSGVSNSQIYKALGNGWTIDVIAHIFSQMEIPVQVYARQLSLL